MHFSPQIMAEINLLSQFNLGASGQGIKVHSDADPKSIAAVKRLYEKGLVTQIDGGYLTDLGRRAAEHAQTLGLILDSSSQRAAS